MVDILIIALVVAGVALAIRSIARSFSANTCAGCASSSSCGKGAASCPACEAVLDDMDERVAARLAERDGDRA